MESYFLLSKNIKRGLRTLLRSQFMVVGALVIAGVALLSPATTTYAVEYESNGNKAACDGSSSRPEVAYGRQGWCGYFKNEGWTDGPGLRGGSWSAKTNPGGSWTEATTKDPAVPKSVDTAQEFIDMVVDDLENGDKRAVTSAQFIILSMLGNEAEGTKKLKKEVTAKQLEDWKQRILSYADEGELKGISNGQNGSIEWFDEVHLKCGSMNTYYQIDQDDVAPFQINERNTPECKDAKSTEEFITFRDSDDNIVFQIKRICMNAAGAIGILSTAEKEEEIEEPEEERPEEEFTPEEEIEELPEEEEFIVEDEEDDGRGGEREPETIVPHEEIVEQEERKKIEAAKAELAATGGPVIFMVIGGLVILSAGGLLATRYMLKR